MITYNWSFGKGVLAAFFNQPINQPTNQPTNEPGICKNLSENARAIKHTIYEGVFIFPRQSCATFKKAIKYNAIISLKH